MRKGVNSAPLDKVCEALIGCPAQRRGRITPLLLACLKDAKEWNEADHPRKENGEFGAGNSSGKTEARSPEATKLLGQEHTGVKGSKAISKLLEERNGHVKGAFTRKDTGPIDLLWGDDTMGLQHIIKRRNEEGFDGESFVQELPNVIRNGKLKKQQNGRFNITLGDKQVIVTPELYGQKITFILTGYEQY
jgi:hypothetical protein